MLDTNTPNLWVCECMCVVVCTGGKDDDDREKNEYHKKFVDGLSLHTGSGDADARIGGLMRIVHGEFAAVRPVCGCCE